MTTEVPSRIELLAPQNGTPPWVLWAQTHIPFLRPLAASVEGSVEWTSLLLAPQKFLPAPLQVWQGGDGDTGIPTFLVVGGYYTVASQVVQSTLRPLGSPNHLNVVVVSVSCQTLLGAFHG